ncbi:MAG: nickel pincer cofactor biosynthesis protein LarB [Deltaproteobacteria bacterium]|nr:nickel pincer cofactor biosynthesis protein LarB [Deltaproteobacteria bacterium]
MNPTELKKLLHALQAGEISLAEAEKKLLGLPFQDLGMAQIDHHRELRQGFPEVVFGENKECDQLDAIVKAMQDKNSNILVTRLSKEKGAFLLGNHPDGHYDTLSRTFVIEQNPTAKKSQGKILIICAGTSDLPVAREAAVTARIFGNEVEELIDVGVAGLHRLLSKTDKLREASVIIVVAGFEGALPSVVGGMVAVPVIAVPTSVGYGASFGGLAALLGMLNSCASGVTVVNIDNGFGAACAATRINQTGFK